MKKVLRGDHHCRRDHHLIRSSAELFISWRGTEFSTQLENEKQTDKQRRQTKITADVTGIVTRVVLTRPSRSFEGKKTVCHCQKRKGEKGELKCTSDHQMQPASQ